LAEKRIKAIVSGAAGRMGQELIRAIFSSPDFVLSAALEKKGHPLLGKDAGTVAGVGELSVLISPESEFEKCGGDLLIEFTFPEPTLKHLEAASKKKMPAVVGSTGFSPQQKQELELFSRKIPILLSPNMSVGVNLLFSLAAKAAQVLGPGYDIEVVEAHHRNKQDAPSGTAIRLAEVLARARGWNLSEVACYHREGKTGIRPDKQIGIQTVRAGDIVGEHTAVLAGAGERIELVHRASSRQTFASGALRAARWILNKPPGLYSMGDCLGIE